MEQSTLKPYWDESRQAVFVPVVNKFLDAKNLSDRATWDDAMKMAKAAGKELPTKKDCYAIMLFKEEIDAILEEHGGDPLTYHWPSQEYSRASAWSVYFSGGHVLNYGKSVACSVRAVVAL